MLGLCYVVIQVIEILIGVWIVHSLYSEYRIYSKWARGILAVSCVILWIIYIGNAWDSFISNIFILFYSVLFSGLYSIWFRVGFLKVFLVEMLYLIDISFLKIPILIVEAMSVSEPLHKVNRGSRTLVETMWCMTLAITIILVGKNSKFVEQYKKSIQLLVSKYTALMLLLTGIQWILLSYNMWLGMQGFQTIDLILCVILILSIFLCLHYLVLRMAYHEVKLENERLDMSQELLQKQNYELHEMYEKNSARMHEYSHNLEYLYYCIREEKYFEAGKFLQKYIGGLNEEKRIVWTGLPFLDFIINYKKQAMDKRGIVFHLTLDVYEYPFKEAELGILLGNLLDNAIEACEKCELGKREIKLHIWNVRYMFMLNLINSSSKSPEVREQQFITDKKEKNAHGMGVEQVRRIVDKYGGDINFQYSGEHFETNVIVSNMKEENT
ncbi:GHKL domain-containing protein [bacterium 1XD21-13]|nr:GHKL domain-containing protein [bacterium 1XD21-13]